MKNDDCNEDKCRDCPERDTCDEVNRGLEAHTLPLSHPLAGLLQRLSGHSGEENVKYKQFCLLDENEIKAFNEMNKATEEAEEAVKKHG